MLKTKNSANSFNEFNLAPSEMPLFKVYYSEYSDLFEEIFLLTEKQFLNKLTDNVNLTMGPTINTFSKIAQAKVISTIKGRCYMTDLRNSKKVKEIMASFGSRDETQKLNRLEISSLIPHCRKTSKAFHLCGRELLRPQATDTDYVICLQCKMIYKPKQIHLYCKECDVEYYSEIDEAKENENVLKPATWEVYHCKGVVDMKMRCPECRDDLFYVKKKDIVKCKFCGFSSDPKKIPYKCTICKENFFSHAKAYSELIYKPMIINIKKALNERIEAKPPSIPCCQIDLKSAVFRHKRECKGILYLGRVNGNKIVVCGECKNMNYYIRNLWYCPKCDKKFKTEGDKNDEDEKLFMNLKSKVSTEEIKVQKPNSNKDKQRQIEHRLGNISLNLNEYTKPNNMNIMHEYVLTEGNFRSNLKPPITPMLQRPSQRRISSTLMFHSGEKFPEFMEIVPVQKEGPKQYYQPKKEHNNINNMNKKMNFSFNIGIDNINSFSTSNIFGNIRKSFLEPSENFYMDEFTFGDQIGEGTFGKIYRVIYNKNNQPYAMKKITGKTEEELNNMKKEYELEMTYSKKNKGKDTGIIKVYGVKKMRMEQSQYGLCVLMELASTDWEREIQRRALHKSYYTEGELMKILKILVRTMAELEQSGIAHRDIKPQNILIVNVNVYKICDFGEAKKVLKDEKYQEVRGTELYMSPILFQALKNGIRKVKHDCFKSDVFSLGFCMIFASTLTFRTLCDIRELKDMDNIQNILVRYLIARYSSEFVDILIKMIQIDEAKRMNFIELERSLRD